MAQRNVFRRLKPPITGALYAVNAFCAFHLFFNYVGSIQLVSGPSMLPTMAQDGEAVIENRLSFRLNPGCLKRGDLVTFESPLTPGRLVCKRLLGLPGDIVCVDPTGLKVPSSEHVVVPKGHVWLMGDNADLSRDSRDYGPVPLSLIRGTIWARVYPFDRMTIFQNPTSFLD
ncbi:LexA/Signal peptidase [Lactifluus volemus]|nr:LexA/Signal peptidase [Lactifluus volemus]